MTATDVLSPDERYARVEKFVHKLVWGFRRKYGLDLDDLVSEAHYGYVQACETYDGRTEFITWVGEKVKRRLQTYVRKVFSERKRPEIDLETVPQPATSRDFDLDGLLEKLTPDGREWVMLVLDAPVPVLMTVAELGETPANYRYAVRTWLKDCGWAVARVTEAFTEVKEAL